MLSRLNLFACARGPSKGMSKPRPSTGGRSESCRPPEPPELLGGATPATALSERPEVAESRASAWGGLPAIARMSRRLDGGRPAAAWFGGLTTLEGAASGKGLIQQGVFSSGREPTPPTVASPENFDSALPVITSPLNDIVAQMRGSGSKGNIFREILSNWHSTDRAVAQPQETELGTAIGNTSTWYSTMSAVEGGSSGRGIIDQGIYSSGCDTEGTGTELAATELGAVDGENDTKTSSSARHFSALESSGSGVCSFQVDACGRGFAAGDDLEGDYDSDDSLPSLHRKYFEKSAAGQKGVLRSQGVVLSPCSDPDLSGRRCSGRPIIRHVKWNKYQHDNLSPLQRDFGADNISGGVWGEGDGGRSTGEFMVEKPTSRPERRFESMWDSDRHSGDEQLADEGKYGDSGESHMKGLPPIPWGARSKKEVDVPRRRSLDKVGIMGLERLKNAPTRKAP